MRQVQISFGLTGQKVARSYPKPGASSEIQMAIGSRLYPQHGNLKSTPEYWYETMKTLEDSAMTGRNGLTLAEYGATDATGKWVLALSTANSPAAFAGRRNCLYQAAGRGFKC